MTVILYDEGMYPSGSANGLVVRENPAYASRGLRMEEHPCPAAGLRLPAALAAGETLVSVQAVRRLAGGELDPSGTVVLDHAAAELRFTPPDSGAWSVLLFVETESKGTIRGVHPGQDDGEPDAPKAADLLNPAAVQAFLMLTHERYYAKLSRYFGTTIAAMFTDEPDLLGRGHAEGLKPWTPGFLEEYLAGGGSERDLPLLWLDAGRAGEDVRHGYETAVRNRLARTYYRALADWCEAHGIGLTGHPAASDDIGLLEPFHIPGQDIVWRYIAPEPGKAIDGVHSTMGKCSSDSARHRGKRRNLNECFGVCGRGNGWALSADEMKWYLDWLFVRGVNLISPHAFYYSIRDDRRNERPPDVGPNNIWWPEYNRFARYIKRMSWMMTDSVNTAEVAVLAQAAYLPWMIAKPMYERQIEFNYLEESLLSDGSCRVEDGTLRIAGQRYRAVLIEDGSRVEPASRQVLEAFVRSGGLVLETAAEALPAELDRTLGRGPLLIPAAASLRVSCVIKEGVTFYVLVNEGETPYEGELRSELAGLAELWDPWEGTTARVQSRFAEEGGTGIPVALDRRQCLVIAIDPGQEAAVAGLSVPEAPAAVVLDLSEGWTVESESAVSFELGTLSSWTEWSGLQHFSGTMAYTKSFEFEGALPQGSVTLDLGEVHELARVWINGQSAGVRLWSPYFFEAGPLLRPGGNELRVEVTNSLANRYDGSSLPSGLVGPVTLRGRGKK